MLRTPSPAPLARRKKMSMLGNGRLAARARRFLLFAPIHIVVLWLSYSAAFLLRFDFSVPNDMLAIWLWTLPWVVTLKLAVFYGCGCFHGQWRFVTLADLATLIQAATLSTLTIFTIDRFLLAGYEIPLVVLLLDWGVTVIALGGVRSAARIIREHPWAVKRKRPVLVVGTEKGDEALLRQIHANPELDYRVIGFLDRDPAYYGSRISGIPFLGSPSDAVSIAQRKQVSDIFVITGSLSGQHLRLLLAACHRASINVKMIPPLGKLLDGTYQLHVRDVDINDLLQRAPVQLDTEAIAKMIQGRRVMVTGAGGSIGSEICRQIIPHQPQRLILVERSENNLFHIQQELAGDAYEVTCDPCVADVCDEERLEVIFQRYKPDVVFHAAAHKHVPLMEINAGEAVKNNVFGTRNVVDLSHKYDVDRFILISTDKVVNPASVMGLSKKLCELYVRAMAAESATKMVVVRFGNVLGSNGSVVPTFQKQIRCGGPVTVTHAKMERFFMTIPEASQLVLQAAVLGRGDEIFVLDMGEPVKIIDLARDLIRLSGFSEEEIETTFVGIRPGEKLYEEINDVHERTASTCHSKLRIVVPQEVDQQKVLNGLAELEPLVNSPEVIVREKLLELTDSGQPLVETVPNDRTEQPACSNRTADSPSVSGLTSNQVSPCTESYRLISGEPLLRLMREGRRDGQ